MGLIYLDACIVIYLVEDHPVWGTEIARAFDRAASVRFVLSPLTKMECLIGPIKRGDRALRREYLEFFKRVGEIDMDAAVYFRAAELRARFGLRTPDALHLACARHHRCVALWTNDDRLAQASRGLARNVVGATPGSPGASH